MNKVTLLRLSGAAATIDGALRMANAVIGLPGSPRAQQLVYFLTDLLLILGLCGIYLCRSHRLGWCGLAGFVTAMAGFLMVRSSTLSLFGLSAYFAGATVTLVGVVALGVSMLMRSGMGRLAPILWIASFTLGLIGIAFNAPDLSVSLAGILFGAGFIAARKDLISGEPSGLD